MKSFVLLQKLAVLIHGLIGTGCALAATYNAAKGNYGKAALYGAGVMWEAKMVDEHLNELLNFPREVSDA